jgi:hypothetical protein
MTRPATNNRRNPPKPLVWERFPFTQEGVIVGKGVPEMTVDGRCKVVVPVAFGSCADKYSVHVPGKGTLDEVLRLKLHQRVRVEGWIVKPPLGRRQLRTQERDGMEIMDRPIFIEARKVELL